MSSNRSRLFLKRFDKNRKRACKKARLRSSGSKNQCLLIYQALEDRRLLALTVLVDSTLVGSLDLLPSSESAFTIAPATSEPTNESPPSIVRSPSFGDPPITRAVHLGDVIELDLKNDIPIPDDFFAINSSVSGINESDGRIFDADGIRKTTFPIVLPTTTSKLYITPRIVDPSKSPDLNGVGTQTIEVVVETIIEHNDTGDQQTISTTFRYEISQDQIQFTNLQLNDVEAEATGLDQVKVAHRLRFLGFTTQTEWTDGTGNLTSVLREPGDYTDDQFKEALKLFKAATAGDGSGNPTNIKIDAKVDSGTLQWLNYNNAPRWVELRDDTPGGDFDIKNCQGIEHVDPCLLQWERYATDWAIKIIEDATSVLPGPQTVNSLSDVWSDTPDADLEYHIEHKAGLDIDINVDQVKLKNEIDAKTGRSKDPPASPPEGKGPEWYYQQLTDEETKVTDEINTFIEKAGSLFEAVYIGDTEPDKAAYPWIIKALKTHYKRQELKIEPVEKHFSHFHLSLKPPAPLLGPSILLARINDGLRWGRVVNNLAGAISSPYGIGLPLTNDTMATLAKLPKRLTDPFQTDLQEGQGFGPPDASLDSIISQLTGFGFDIEYIGIETNANGDYLRATYNPDPFPLEVVPLSIGFKTGFDYFDDGLQGNFEGNLSATVKPITVKIIVGIDAVDGVPTFFIGEESSIDIGGITMSGNIDAKIGIKNLLDVEVKGPFSGSIKGALTFFDSDSDDKLRIEQFLDPFEIIRPSAEGELMFTPTLTATLPLVGALSWGATANFKVELDEESQRVTGTASFGLDEISLAKIDEVEQLVKNGYEVVSGVFKLLGGTDTESDLPVVGSGLGSILGLPEDPNKKVTDGELGSNEFKINVNATTVAKLFNGEDVDLITFKSRYKEEFKPAALTVPLFAAAFPIGPIPVTAELAFTVELEANLSYYVGLGIDTSGFYIDPGTYFAASGSILAGLKAEVSIAKIVGMNVFAGVGGSVALKVGFIDPNPSDGRIYLDELILPGVSVDASLLNVTNVSLAGDAFAFARGKVKFLFFEWEVFNEKWVVARFNETLSPSNHLVESEYIDNLNEFSLRGTSGFSPWSNEDELDDLVVEDKVLTIDARLDDYSQKGNTVAVSRLEDGSTEVIWRGIGTKTFAADEVEKVIYHGNSFDDRFYVDKNVIIPVDAYGHGGDDYINVEGSGFAVIYGGSGNDVLSGGSGGNVIEGGDDDDIITGGALRDILSGAAGNDRIDGMAGNDDLFGGSGMDVLIGGSNMDTLDGGAENDILYGGFGIDTLNGGAGADFLYGEQGADILDGGSGDDVLIGGSGGDTLWGGDGDDSLFGDRGGADPDPLRPDGNDFLYGQDGNDRLYGEGGDDTLVGDDDGQAGDDILLGLAGNDTLLGGDGDDYLSGGEDDDELHGGDGNDELNGNGGVDMLFGEAGEDTLQIDFDTADGGTADEVYSGGPDRDMIAIVGATIEDDEGDRSIQVHYDDYIRVTHLGGNYFKAENLDIEGEPLLNDDQLPQLIFFSLDVTSSGDIEDVAIYGLGGDDKLEIGLINGEDDALDGKNFILDGGEGDDWLTGGEGRDTLRGGPGNDRLEGNGNEDALYGGPGRDVLEGGGGVDYVDAGAGADTVLGGYGREIIYGGPGNDILIAGSGFFGSIIHGGGGDDIIVGSSGRDVLNGDADDDTILGGEFGDTINGGPGEDLIIGESGRDVINGNGGDDVLYSHLNNDVRVRLGFAPFAELTPEERSALRTQYVAEQTRLKELRESPYFKDIEDRCDINACSPEERAELTYLANAQDIINKSIGDLDAYQTTTVDTISGGKGDDTIYGSPYYDVIDGGDDDDDIYASGGYFLDPDSGEPQEGDTIKGGDGVDTLWFDGTEYDDQISITSVLVDGNRRATVTSNGVTVGFVEELTIEFIGVNALAGNDHVVINLGSWAGVGVRVNAGPGDDYVDASGVGLEGEIEDELQSKAKLFGGAGDDTLIGGRSNDTLEGGSGNDRLEGGDGQDSIYGGAGNDLIYGGDDNDKLFGGIGHDVIYGGTDDGADELYGGAGEDTLRSGGGNDYLDGGLDVDEISTGLGVDTVVRGIELDVVSNDGALNWQDQGLRVSDKVLANFSSMDSFGMSHIAMAADGHFIITWAINTTDDYGIYSQRFDYHGQAIGNAIRVNGQTIPRRLGSTAINPDGSFVVSWTSLDDDEDGVFARRFDANGEPFGNEFQVNTFTTSRQWWSSVAMNSDGQFWVTWGSDGQDGSGYGIYSQRYDASGQPVGGEFRVNSYAINDQFRPTITSMRDGGFVIAWESTGQDGSQRGIYSQRYDSEGQRLGNEFLVNSETDQEQAAAAIASTANGGYVIAWVSLGQDGSDTYDIYAQRFGVSGQPIGDEFRVNSETERFEGSRPSIAAAPGGGFVITWGTYGENENGGQGAFAQRFNSAGERIGSEFRVSSSSLTDETIRYPSIAMVSDNRFVIIYEESVDNETNVYDVYFRLFDSAAPTQVVSMATNTQQTRTITFSEGLRESNIGGVSDTDNWQLFRDDDDISRQIENIKQTTHQKDLRVDVTFTFTGPLTSGNYALKSKSVILDWSGRELDGNSGGVEGDYYVERFTISPPPVPLGTEMPASAGPLGDYQSPTLAVNPNDRSYVVVWQGPGVTAGELDVYARRFDAIGTPIGSSVRVNTITSGDQTQPAIAMDTSGNYVVIWDATVLPASGHVVYGRRFNADGTPLDVDQISIKTTVSAISTNPSVTIAPSGDFVVAWQSDDLAQGVSDIYVRQFAKGSTELGPAIRVDSQTTTIPSSSNPQIAMNGTAEFIVTWKSMEDGSDKIMARWFDADGVGEDEFRVSESSAEILDGQQIAMNQKGEFAIVWRNQTAGDSNVFAQRYDPERRPNGGQFEVNATTTGNQTLPEVVIDADGNLIVLWANNESGLSDGYTARWFDKWGNLLADEFQVTSVPDLSNASASVGMSPDGEFVIAWSTQDATSSSLHTQRYTLLPPSVENVSINLAEDGFVVSFSQPMATSGAGSVLFPTNWGLRLSDGRYIVHDDPDNPGTNPLATPEQFGPIVPIGFNPVTGLWEVRVSLNFSPTQTELLIPRSSLTDVAGRHLGIFDVSNLYAKTSVLTEEINGGSINRSGLGTVALEFNNAVTISGPTALRLYNPATSQLIDISTATVLGNGSPTLTWNLSGITLPDGRYTAELVNTQVKGLGGLPLSSSYAFEFHVRRGDVDGDGVVAVSDFGVIGANFDPLAGTPYRVGDADGDGKVAVSDFGVVGANFNPIAWPQLGLDFGDTPDSATFPTLLSPNNGARHVITGNTTFLGTLRDKEPDGQPTGDATGDGADEDGIVVGNLTIGTGVPVTVTASVPGTAFLNAWIDFNQDGDWDDLGEQVFKDQVLPNGTSNLAINVPDNATVGSSLARFRIAELPGFSYFGLAPNGEAEDYLLSIAAATPTTLAEFDLFSQNAYNFNATHSENEVTWFEVLHPGGVIDLMNSIGSEFDTEIGLYDVDGALVLSDDDGGGNLTSNLNGINVVAGTYFLAASGYDTSFGATAFDVTAGTAAGNLIITVALEVPTTLATFDLFSQNGYNFNATHSENEVSWFEILHPGGAIGIMNSIGSDFNTEIGLYDMDGALVLSDDDGGGNSTSSLNGINVVGGTYYLAASGFDAIFGETAFFVIAGNEPGNLNITVALEVPTTLATFDLFSQNAYNFNATHSENEVSWFEVLHPGGDIDLMNSIGSEFDTEIGLYEVDGDLVLSDDDDGGNWTSSLNGINVVAGTYYLAASGYDTSFGATAFDVIAGTAAGNLNINVVLNDTANLSYFGLAPSRDVDDFQINYLVAETEFATFGDNVDYRAGLVLGTTNSAEISRTTALTRARLTLPTVRPMFDLSGEKDKQLRRWQQSNRAATIELVGSVDSGFPVGKLVMTTQTSNRFGASAKSVTEVLAIDEAFAMANFDNDWMTIKKLI